MAHSVKGITKAMDYWWLLLLTGIALVSMGLWVFISPEDAYISLSVLFGVCILFVGVFELLFAFSAKRSLNTWGWTVASGIFDVLVGCFVLVYPHMTASILPYVLGVWLLLRGLSAIGFAFDMRRFGAIGWGWLFWIERLRSRSALSRSSSDAGNRGFLATSATRRTMSAARSPSTSPPMVVS